MAAFDALYSNLNIHVSGAGPKRREPLECFRPVHQSYFRGDDANRSSRPIASAMHASIPGGTLRTIPSAAMKDGAAVVYDRDIVTTWRLAGSMAAYEIYF
jgi:hypothetical protein